MLYTGAGISTASRIADYASLAAGRQSLSAPGENKVASHWDVAPTLAHCVLSAVHHQVKPLTWVQQNHYVLPQKAGFPQQALNEIHGAWYDPSNPVVPMSVSLRTDLFEWLLDLSDNTCDFSLVLGSSLCGMNADRMVTAPAARARQGVGQGAVSVSLQRTKLDDQASVHIFAGCDDFACLLAQELGVEVAKVAPFYHLNIPRSGHADAQEDDSRRFFVPDHPATGHLLTGDRK